MNCDEGREAVDSTNVLTEVGSSLSPMASPPVSKDVAEPDHPSAEEEDIMEQVASQLLSLSFLPAGAGNPTVGVHDDQKPPSFGEQLGATEHDGVSRDMQTFLREKETAIPPLTTSTATSSSPKPQGAPASRDGIHRLGRTSRSGALPRKGISTSPGVEEAGEKPKVVHFNKRLRYTMQGDGSVEFAFTFYNKEGEMICAEVDDGVHVWMPRGGSTALEAFPQITLFAIGKPFQNQGYGRACLLSIEEFARSEGHRQLYVKTPGNKASGFYTACGYQDCGGKRGGGSDV